MVCYVCLKEVKELIHPLECGCEMHSHCFFQLKLNNVTHCVKCFDKVLKRDFTKKPNII